MTTAMGVYGRARVFKVLSEEQVHCAFRGKRAAYRMASEMETHAHDYSRSISLQRVIQEQIPPNSVKITLPVV